MTPADSILMVLGNGPSTFPALERQAEKLLPFDPKHTQNKLISALNGLVVSKRVEWDPVTCVYHLTGKGPGK
jgi:hypothetical protein